MSYKFETQWDSPNFSVGNSGRKMIILHWWDDPAKNPSYEGVINTLCNPSRGASAHFVATGTDRRVACLVDLNNTAWHAGTSNPATNPNPISIGIECDPRCRPEDYDVVAELIANIRSAFGDIPLRRHSDFVATTCPGNWDLVKLDALARTKDGSGDWGVVTDIKPVTPPIIPPVDQCATKVKPLEIKITELNTEIARLKALPPKEVIKEIPVEKIVIEKVPMSFDELTLGELLGAAIKKLLHIK